MSFASVIRQLANHCLVMPASEQWAIEWWPQVDLQTVHRVVALTGCGLDPLAGENLIAVLHDKRRSDGRGSFLITDRRMIGHDSELCSSPHGDTQVWNLPFADVAAVAMPTGEAQAGEEAPAYFSIQRHSGPPQTFTSTAFLEPVARLLDAVSAVPTHLRSDPQGLANPSETDPTGASSAANGVGPDGRIYHLLRLIHEAHRQGRIPLVAGRDLGLRAALLHRSVLMGRGQSQGWWLSPLDQEDLRCLLFQWFGWPLAEVEQGGSAVIDYAIEPSHWLNAHGQSHWSGLRVELSSSQGCTGFRLSRTDGATYAELSPRASLRVSQALLPLETHALTLRAAFGWDMDPEPLFAQSEQAIDAQIRPLGISVPALRPAAE